MDKYISERDTSRVGGSKEEQKPITKEGVREGVCVCVCDEVKLQVITHNRLFYHL